MILKMDKMSAPSSREFAQRLYDKNIELENRRRKSAQARIPTDPNAWQQMRENYEAIILEDHAFSEQHNIEYALWQLHYKRIEEFRAHFNAALASSGSNTSQGGKGPSRPDRITKIRLQFKTFLSEATGYYHDLVLKVRAKYGLPLGSFSEGSEHQVGMEKSGKNSPETKKGLISCHRCLIYLGDLARYKGLYGEGDSKSRDFAAASSYYLQAASLWPSSGNPHHQLAILASYDGDELVAVYWYFRSLAVDFPFSTARDNLIVAFEKNRQSYSQLHVDAKASAPKESRLWISGKGRGKKESKLPYKDANLEVSIVGDTSSTAQDTFKVFCINFVRLNGILFTRTSLETFDEVLLAVTNGLLDILSTGTEEKPSFGGNALESGLLVVRLISILIFTVHNVNKQTEGQTYAEILQRNVLLQNAFTAVFEFMAKILNRCAQLHDPSSSFLLPGVLVFLEWLACCPDVAVSSDGDEKQASVRLAFWNQYTLLLNKFTSNGLVSVDDDEDENCFFNMSSYEEGETENRLALWEDFELRGFSPLLPAQTILDFSRKHSFAIDGNKEKKARIKRVLAAGKALKNIVRVGPKTLYFDSNAKKFVIGIEPQKLDDFAVNGPPVVPNSDGVLQEAPAEKTIDSGVLQSMEQLIVEGDEEEEVIVFKPTVFEKPIDATSHSWMGQNDLEPGKIISSGDSQFYSGGASVPLSDVHPQTAFRPGLPPPVSLHQINPQNLPSQQQTLANGLKSLDINESMKAKIPETQQRINISYPDSLLLPMQHPLNFNVNGLPNGQTRTSEAVVPSKVESAVFSGVKTDSLVGNSSSTFSTTSRSPVSRPVRHLGPPPGFGQVATKQVNEPISGSYMTCENPLMDDYSWLDGYQLPASVTGLQNSINHVSNTNAEFISKSNGITGTMGFPFPGKQVSTLQFQEEKQKLWQDHPIENLKLHHEQPLQHHKQLVSGNQQFTPLSEQYQGPSIWTGQYFV